MHLTRHFTREGQSPYADVTFVSKSSRMTKLDGSVVFSMDDVIVPSTWDQTATDVLAQKYFRRKGCDHSHQNSLYRSSYARHIWSSPLIVASTRTHETDLRETIHRIVGALTAAGERLGYFEKESAQVFYDEMSYLMATQRMAPNSPQWFNTGLGWAYGLTGTPQGHYHAEGGEAAPSEDAYSYSSSSACFIQSVTDDLMGDGGITDLWTREARVFKFGGGSGTNVSAIRGKNEPLSGGGTSSGLMSFLRVSDRAAGAIKSGGTTRRAARIVSLDIDHPDVEEFIAWKVAEERKVAMLVAGSRALRFAWDAMCGAVLTSPDVALDQNPAFVKAVRQARIAGVPLGFIQEAQARIQQRIYTMPIRVMDVDYEGEAYETVSAQNANNSIRVTDTFMVSMVTGGDWQLTRRVDGTVCKTLPSRGLWKTISEAAWACADPGLQFDTTINFWHTCPHAGRINASNPCCFTGDTLVDTSEGPIAIGVLKSMCDMGQDLPYVFSFDFATGLPVLRKINRAWSSGHVTSLVRVTTQRGYSFTCTPDHRFYLQNGTPVCARDLKPNMRLRKIARWANDARSSRRQLNHRATPDTPNGTSIQARWMWEQAYGPLAADLEVHHINEDPTDDRLSNFDLIHRIEHRVDHSTGSHNARFIQAEPHVLVDVWEAIERTPRRTHKSAEPKVTTGRWNTYVRANNLCGIVPLARPATSISEARIQGKTWTEFAAWIEEQKAVVNDRVASVEEITREQPVEVFDIEVEGTHNFGILQEKEGQYHSVIVHNSEFHFLDNTACNLASLNLVPFLVDGAFDIESFVHAVKLTTIALDITVSMSQYPSALMAQLSEDYRPLGLGYANLGGLLMRHGIPYDSTRGREMAASITALMTGAAYHTSALLAEHVGPFAGYNADHMLRVMHNHATLADGDNVLEGEGGMGVSYVPLTSTGVIAVAAREVWHRALSAATLHGVRNSQVTVLAPTGTIGLVMGCDTTGIEPDFALVKFKKLAGGGYMRLVNTAVPVALTRLGYTDEQVNDIMDYVGGKSILGGNTRSITRQDLERNAKFAGKLAEWDKALTTAFDPSFVLPVDDLEAVFGAATVKAFLLEVGGYGTLEGAPHLRPEHLPVFDCASRCGVGGVRSIAPMGHINMMAVVQPYISGAISKTVNLPGDATVDEVSDIYHKAWQLGLKAVALYRDGSKLSQPLASTLELLDVVDTEVLDDPAAQPVAKVAAVAEVLTRHALRRKLPSRRGGYTQAVKIADTKVYLRTGEYEDGTLGEIFLDTYKEGAAFKAILNSFAVAVSIGLQYGVPLEEFCDAFLFAKFEPNGPVRDHDVVKMCLSLPDFIFRDLAITYLHRYELAHVSPEDLISEAGPRKPMSGMVSHSQTFGVNPNEVVSSMDLQSALAGEPAPAKKPDARGDAIRKGYTGDPCPSCGHLTMVRSGTCARCTTCGGTSGCS